MSYLGRSAKLSLKAQEKVSFLATAGQTVKTGLSYVPNFVEVYVNGILLTDTTDFTATNGNSVTFTVALALNDEVTVVSLKTFTVADHYTKSQANALLVAKAALASPSFTGNVGINNSSPTQRLEINGNAQFNMYDNTGGNGGYYTTKGLQIGNAFDAGESGGGDDRNAIVWNERGTNLLFGTNDLERMRITYDGNVGIGVVPDMLRTSDTALALGGTDRQFVTSSNHYVNQNNAKLDASGNPLRIIAAAATRYQMLNTGVHTFDVTASGSAGSAISWTNAMTIDNARSILIGRPNAGWSDTQGLALNQGNSGENYVINNGVVFYINRGNTEGKTIRFYKSIGTEVGNISTFGASTAYNTSSDYRIKTDVQPITAAADRVKLLKPCNFEWIADGSRADGFLAHELAEVVPIAVTGAKDAMEDEEYEVTPAVVDDEDNETTAAVMGTRSVPDLQGIDQSKLVPLLTATIQELITRIEALEAAAPE